jgi:hypothetical protein
MEFPLKKWKCRSGTYPDPLRLLEVVKFKSRERGAGRGSAAHQPTPLGRSEEPGWRGVRSGIKRWFGASLRSQSIRLLYNPLPEKKPSLRYGPRSASCFHLSSSLGEWISFSVPWLSSVLKLLFGPLSGPLTSATDSSLRPFYPHHASHSLFGCSHCLPLVGRSPGRGGQVPSSD